MAKTTRPRRRRLLLRDFHAVQNVNLAVPPVCDCFHRSVRLWQFTVLRTLNRMTRSSLCVRQGTGSLDGEDIYGHHVDPVAVRNTIRDEVFQKANPFPTTSI